MVASHKSDHAQCSSPRSESVNPRQSVETIHSLFQKCIGERTNKGPPSPIHKPVSRRLDEELLNLGLDSLDLAVELTGLVGGNGSSNDGAGDTTSTAEGSLGGNEDVGRVLVLTEEGEVEDNLDGLNVTGDDDELGDTTVKLSVSES